VKLTTPEPLGLFAQLACLWEATACKPGNIHRFADFQDADYLDFLVSAAAIGSVFDRAAELAVGELVLEAIQRTRTVVGTNTNLGMVLLLAPLAKATSCRAVSEVLDQATVRDAELVYQAIRRAAPAGLGEVQEQDIKAQPTQPLRQVMALAAERDMVARQYANGFDDVLGLGVRALGHGLQVLGTLEGAIIECFLRLLARHPDSLIVRKCGSTMANEVSARATKLLDVDFLGSAAGIEQLNDFDTWLRGDGHCLNPGTTADLVAACLFVALREGIIISPPQYRWSRRVGNAHGAK
jgi:triphosphoribosyl-dephospho-CoA synthase